MDRPTDALGHVTSLGDVGVGGIVQQVGLAPEAVEDAIQQRQAFGGAVQDDGLREVDEGGGDGKGGSRPSLRLVGRESYVFEQLPLHRPDHRLGRHPLPAQYPSRCAPAVEVDLGPQPRHPHQNRLNCSGAISEARNPAPSVAAPGVQSAVTMNGLARLTEPQTRLTSSRVSRVWVRA